MKMNNFLKIFSSTLGHDIMWGDLLKANHFPYYPNDFLLLNAAKFYIIHGHFITSHEENQHNFLNLAIWLTNEGYILFHLRVNAVYLVSTYGSLQYIHRVSSCFSSLNVCSLINCTLTHWMNANRTHGSLI